MKRTRMVRSFSPWGGATEASGTVTFQLYKLITDEAPVSGIGAERRYHCVRCNQLLHTIGRLHSRQSALYFTRGH
jgi:hypothetical protein